MKKELSYSSDMNEVKLVTNGELTKFIFDGKVCTLSDRQLFDIAKTITIYLEEKESKE